MNILLPLTSDDIESANLVNLDKVQFWGLLNLSEGKIIKTDFFKDRTDISEFIDCVVVASKDDYVWPFLEESIPVLEAPLQRSVDDVIEAFLFKELYEVN